MKTQPRNKSDHAGSIIQVEPSGVTEGTADHGNEDTSCRRSPYIRSQELSEGMQVSVREASACFVRDEDATEDKKLAKKTSHHTDSQSYIRTLKVQRIKSRKPI